MPQRHRQRGCAAAWPARAHPPHPHPSQTPRAAAAAAAAPSGCRRCWWRGSCRRRLWRVPQQRWRRPAAPARRWRPPSPARRACGALGCALGSGAESCKVWRTLLRLPLLLLQLALPYAAAPRCCWRWRGHCPCVCCLRHAPPDPAGPAAGTPATPPCCLAATAASPPPPPPPLLLLRCLASAAAGRRAGAGGRRRRRCLPRLAAPPTVFGSTPVRNRACVCVCV
jgi:hypothetical protein